MVELRLQLHPRKAVNTYTTTYRAVHGLLEPSLIKIALESSWRYALLDR